MNNQQPPASRSAEAAVLGSMLLDPATIPVVMELLTTVDFYHVENRIIFDAMVELHNENNGAVDGVLLKERLESTGKLKEIGGVPYLVKVIESVPTSANIEHYAHIIKTKSLERDMMLSTSKLSQVINDSTADIDEKKAAFEQANMELQTTVTSKQEHVKDIAMRVYTEIESREVGVLTNGIATGFFELDEMTGGLSGGQLIIIAGRPSMGKTALAINIAVYMAINKHKPLFFSMEDSSERVVERIMSSLGKVDSQNMKHGRIDGEGWSGLAASLSILSEVEMWIDPTATLSPAALTAKTLAAKAKLGVDCIFVDFIQLMKIAGKFDNRQAELTTITRQLKALAKKADIPVIILSQLNREVDKRPNHRPMLNDLKASGSIEEDADIVLLLYREDYYRKREKKKGQSADLDGKGVLIVAKQKQGPTGDIDLLWIPEITSFRDPPNESDENLFEGEENE